MAAEHHFIQEGDLEVLSMLSSLPTPSESHGLPADHHRVHNTVAALRRPPIDPIVLAATLSSGPQVTRHHFHHTFHGPDSTSQHQSQQMPVSERLRRGPAPAAPPAKTRPAPPPRPALEDHRPVLQSRQAPRSVRLQQEKERMAKAQVDAPLNLPARDVKPPPKSLPPLEVRCCGRTRVPTPHGEIFCHLYRNNHDAKEHMALVIDPAQNHESIQRQQKQGLLQRPRHLRSRTLDAVWHDKETPMERLVRGAYVNRLSETHQEASKPMDSLPLNDSLGGTPAPLVRIHSECYTGETIGSQRCDCGEQLDEALRIICTTMSHTTTGQRVPPRGVIVYMRQEGRGIGLLDKLLAYNLQDMGHDTVSANVLLGHLPDARRYDMSSAILRDLGIEECRLLTNNPEKMQAMEAEGIRVTERVPMVPRMWRYGHTHKRRPRRAGPRRPKDKVLPRMVESLVRSERQSRPSSVISQVMDGQASPDLSPEDQLSDGGWDDDDDDDQHSDESAGSFQLHSERRAGATMVGGSATRGTDLERYLRTKIERMGHMLSEPGATSISMTLSDSHHAHSGV